MASVDGGGEEEPMDTGLNAYLEAETFSGAGAGAAAELPKQQQQQQQAEKPRSEGVSRVNLARLEKLFGPADGKGSYPGRKMAEQMRKLAEEKLPKDNQYHSILMDAGQLLTVEQMRTPDVLRPGLPLCARGINAVLATEDSMLSYILLWTPLVNVAVHVTELFPYLTDQNRTGTEMFAKTMDSFSILRLYRGIIKYLVTCANNLPTTPNDDTDFTIDEGRTQLWSYRRMLCIYVRQLWDAQDFDGLCDVLQCLRDNVPIDHDYLQSSLSVAAIAARGKPENASWIKRFPTGFETLYKRCHERTKPEKKKGRPVALTWECLQIVLESMVYRITAELLQKLVPAALMNPQCTVQTLIEPLLEHHQKSCRQITADICTAFEAAALDKNASATDRHSLMLKVNFVGTLRLMCQYENTILDILSTCSTPKPCVDPAWVLAYKERRDAALLDEKNLPQLVPQPHEVTMEVATQLIARRMHMRAMRQQVLYMTQALQSAGGLPRDETQFRKEMEHAGVLTQRLPDGTENRLRHMMCSAVWPEPEEINTVIELQRMHIEDADVFATLHYRLVKYASEKRNIGWTQEGEQPQAQEMVVA